MRAVRGLSIPIIAGIVFASIVSLALTLYIFWMKGFLGGKYLEDKCGISYQDIECVCCFKLIACFKRLL